MPDCPCRPKDSRDQEHKRFVEKIGEKGPCNTDGKCPTIPGYVKDAKSEQDTGKEMGTDIHRAALPADGKTPGSKENKVLQGVLIIRSNAVHGLLQDLDVGYVVLAQ